MASHTPKPPPPPPPKYFRIVPACIEQWKSFAAVAKITNKWIGDFEKLESGSNLSQKQFLLFRVVIVTLSIDKFDPEDFQLQTQFSRAVDIVRNSESFKSFLKAIEEDKEDAAGYFAPIREQQAEILTPVPDKRKLEGPTGFDESPVNSILINYMKATQKMTENRDKWRYTKAHLQSSFPSAGVQHGAKRQKPDDRSFTAIADGQLQDADSYRIKIVLECKRDRRQKCGASVDMQEAAELVAWIRQYPSNERQRVIVAQNGPEMYITFGRYDTAWLSYLDRKNVQGKKSFLEMTRIGPYFIDDVDHMREVTTILVALHL